jgi:acyl dehydratase
MSSTADVGTEIPPWKMESVDPQRMKTMAAILRDPYPIHWDHKSLESLPTERVVNQGPLNLSYIANMLMAWQGPASIRRLKVNFTGWVLEGDEVTATGTVTSIDDVADERHATCDIRLARGDKDVVVGTAVVALSPTS